MVPPHYFCVLCVWISEQTALYPYTALTVWFCITEAQSDYCAVRYKHISSSEGSVKIPKLIVFRQGCDYVRMDFDINFICVCYMNCNRLHSVADGIILSIWIKVVQARYPVTNSWTAKVPYSLVTENWLGAYYTIRIVCFSPCWWFFKVKLKSARTMHGAARDVWRALCWL